ncbi:oligogalacturonate-specific porin KdgM family protein [Alteromonas facilis]|uniref:oligogalacturonate-specific porin KdgM family protein n=1 Tax=Alteromonas facilis TaxID=2048004 RepID=UPI000C28A169|nr:oligogalacturonate-specific porin KdgM family protein [Alteromonas facilis]
MRRVYVSLVSLAVVSGQSQADLEVFPTLTTGIVVQNAKPQEQDARSVESITIDPSLTINYQTADFSGSWTMSHMHLIRDADGDSFKDDFSTYDYQASFKLIDGLLAVNARGALDLRNLTPGDYLITDRFFNPEALSKTRTNNVSLDLNADQLDYIVVEGSLSYSDVDSEEQALSTSNLAGTTYSATSVLSQGDAFDSAFFTIKTEYSQTENDGNSLISSSRKSDQTSRNIDGIFNHRLYGDIGLVLRGSDEGLKFDGAINIDTRRNFNSYGAGLSYSPSNNRYIALTVNQGNRDDEDETYLGANIRWAFSGRTRLTANIGRRYYGDSGSFSFDYNTKTLRASVRYSEQATNFSRLIANSEALGSFVCPPNSIDISTCYQPSSLNPTLEPGEQLVEFSDNVIEVSDEPILIKSTNAVIGYSKTRFSGALEFRYSNPFYEDSGREQVTYTTNLNLGYQLGSKTQLQAQFTYIESNNKRGTDGIGQNFDDTIYRATGTVRYQLARNWTAETELRFMDRDSNTPDRVVSDRRITFNLEYRFK